MTIIANDDDNNYNIKTNKKNCTVIAVFSLPFLRHWEWNAWIMQTVTWITCEVDRDLSWLHQVVTEQLSWVWPLLTPTISNNNEIKKKN